MVAALGGDGTILKAVHLLGYVEVPILGVNHGRLGFLSGAPAGSLRAQSPRRWRAKAASSGGRRSRHRSSWRVARLASTGLSTRSIVGKGSAGRVIEADSPSTVLRCSRTTCDGIIVATPTGSTAYALSAGGPIVSPDVAATVVVPVAPHTFSARAIVTGPGDVIEIQLPDPARSDGCVTVDGDVTPCRQAIESVTVKRCDSDVLLVKLDGPRVLRRGQRRVLRGLTGARGTPRARSRAHRGRVARARPRHDRAHRRDRSREDRAGGSDQAAHRRAS